MLHEGQQWTTRRAETFRGTVEWKRLIQQPHRGTHFRYRYRTVAGFCGLVGTDQDGQAELKKVASARSGISRSEPMRNSGELLR
jgi:hypothetical protein